MASSDRYAVQTFKRSGTGAFSAGRSIACKTADEARLQAERSCAGRDDAGAAAFLLKGDEYLGSTEEPIAIAVFGVCPPEIVDNIPF
ncbi:hypothetical protein [Methylobacterium sp.]|uniref:hypothetical protein n=1 Tax=Methylobacterium sp. TaxID=409 RepID=UPI003B5A05D6